MGVVIHTRRISRCMEGKYIGRSRGELLEYKTVGEFLVDIRKEFGGGDKESVKVAELQRIEQGNKMIEKFVQEFQRTARGSRYKRRPLVEEFKRGMNGAIRRKLIEAEHQPELVEQWYNRATSLDRNWRESKKKEERLRGRQGVPASRQEMIRQKIMYPQIWPRKQEMP